MITFILTFLAVALGIPAGLFLTFLIVKHVLRLRLPAQQRASLAPVIRIGVIAGALAVGWLLLRSRRQS